MEKKYSIEELSKLLVEYTKDPYNHESCCYGRQDGPEDIIKECDCGLYDLVEQYLLWIRDSNRKKHE